MEFRAFHFFKLYLQGFHDFRDSHIDFYDFHVSLMDFFGFHDFRYDHMDLYDFHDFNDSSWIFRFL